MTPKSALGAIAAIFFLFSCKSSPAPVDYVDPTVGNISHLLVPTYPTVQLPHSMVRIFPNKTDASSDIYRGLPLIVTNHRGRAAMNLAVSARGGCKPETVITFDNEHITPYLWEATLEDGNIDLRYAPSHQAALYELAGNAPLTLALHCPGGTVRAEGSLVKGAVHLNPNATVYVCMETRQEPRTLRVLPEGDQVVLGFDSPLVNLRYGISYISEDQALSNLRRELQDYDVDALAAKGRDIWNKALGAIQVKGGSKADKTVFYTSLYRTLERPVCISEDGRYWSAEDKSVHEDGGTPYYTDDWLWDTYRAAHPLRILTDAQTEEDILHSYLQAARHGGRDVLPNFPEVTGDARCMNSNHLIASYADAAVKGLDIDVETAARFGWNTLTKKTLAPWSGAPAGEIDRFFWEHGYIPALREGEKETDPNVNDFEKRQPVAVTLGTAYDCWALSQLAALAGLDSLSGAALEASYAYRNLFNPETGFFHPKDKDGNFIPDLDYNYPGGMGAREYYDENNAWVYRWDVQHNIGDLIGLMGGPEAFTAALDSMFHTPLGRPKYEFFAKLPDHTGNVGQFSMANEPSLHVPYLYNYAGAPWKTQKRIRQLLDTWFRPDLMGVPGDEDGGGMTAFVVFSAMGFYPVTPGSDVYTVGSPRFRQTTVHLSGGKTFRIVADAVSDDAKYIQRATLNGKPLEEPFFTHSQLMEGGELHLWMGEKPNAAWGVRPQNP